MKFPFLIFLIIAFSIGGFFGYGVSEWNITERRIETETRLVENKMKLVVLNAEIKQLKKIIEDCNH